MAKNKAGGSQETGRDWRETLFLPQTDFPMRAGLPKREPEALARWDRLGLYERLRKLSKGREKFVLHDGPPYANGHLHIGHALNKILKDVITRSQQMMGKDSNYVPGWDCHGLPIEWKIEEPYRAKGKNKDEVPTVDFRRECREFAEHWIDVQRTEFKRMGVEGDWANPYTTMSFEAEARIAEELMKFAMNGALYRGSKPVMWSVVERTALAEAEIEYHDYQSDTVWVKFPFDNWGGTRDDSEKGEIRELLSDASIVIWTTTPWTIPGNRAICYSDRVSYGMYQVTEAPEDNWARVGDKLVLADRLADGVMKQARVEGFKKILDVTPDMLRDLCCEHPLKKLGYDFKVPLLEADHVTDEEGTGFVHTAPGHGREDFDIWMDRVPWLKENQIDTEIPFTVGGDGRFTEQAPGFTGKQVITDNGKKGDANQAVIDALVDEKMLLARGRLKHQYPHSWRSKKPVIFRNTPQWFIAMDENIEVKGQRANKTLREMALAAIDDTRFVPRAGQRRLRSMIESRPDWVISRQRAWGVPITVFVRKGTNDYIPNAEFNGSAELIERIGKAFRERGADAWFEEGSKAAFLDGLVDNVDEWEQVSDILDVWFDSGSTHTYVLEQRQDLKWPADVYLEGSDQHRGWFHSSLLESCGTRGRAPYDTVITHGFTMDEEGRKMSKSLGNIVDPQHVIGQSGADILRLWVMTTDYADDQRIGPEILKSNVDAYRKLRNTFRFLLGNLHHHDAALAVPERDMPELERYMLHRLHELDQLVRKGYDDFDFKRISQALFNFATVDLSAFYFDIRKDALYCDPYDGLTRRACLTVLDEVFSHLTAWLAPMLCFTAEEVWLARYPSEDGSVHMRVFPDVPKSWADAALAEKWRRIRAVRRVVTGALEVERREKRIGSSLEAAPVVHIDDKALREALKGVDFAEIAITSAITIADGIALKTAFRLDEVNDVAVVVNPAEGRRCERSWKILPEVGEDPEYPDLSPRDGEAVRQFAARRRAAQ